MQNLLRSRLWKVSGKGNMDRANLVGGQRLDSEGMLGDLLGPQDLDTGRRESTPEHGPLSVYETQHAADGRTVSESGRR